MKARGESDESGTMRTRPKTRRAGATLRPFEGRQRAQDRGEHREPDPGGRERPRALDPGFEEVEDRPAEDEIHPERARRRQRPRPAQRRPQDEHAAEAHGPGDDREPRRGGGRHAPVQHALEEDDVEQRAQPDAEEERRVADLGCPHIRYDR